MKTMFNAFAKKLFGANYERLVRTFFIELIVFSGLRLSDFRIPIAPSVCNLMVSTFTAGVMWQALTSEGLGIYLQHMLMLPFHRLQFVFSYLTALGVYAIVTKTGVLLSILLACSDWKPAEIFVSALCVENAVFMTAAGYPLRKYRYVFILWAAAVLTAILFLENQPWLILFLLVNSIFAVLLLQRVDAYAFYVQKEGVRIQNSYVHSSVRRYFFRYLKCHKNYLVNTVVMWGVACVLPRFSIGPISFVILCLNTPLCILLSCDTALEQAVRFLPGQKGAFCVPYCLFIFLSNLAANVIYLCSMQIQNGGVTVWIIAAGIYFALQSAICSVLLEWFAPIRGWKIESDLWHHPRKYVVPALLLLLAAGIGEWPGLILVLYLLLAVEAVAVVKAAKAAG